MIFVDTPGIHKSTTKLNKRMMDSVRASAEADVVLFLADATARPSDEDAEAVDLVKKLRAPVIAVLNKVDKVQPKQKVLDVIARYQQMHEFAPELPDVHALRDDQADIKRQLQPARAEDQHGDRAQPHPLGLKRRLGRHRHGRKLLAARIEDLSGGNLS